MTFSIVRLLGLVTVLMLVGWSVGQPDPDPDHTNSPDDDGNQVPRSSVPRFRLIRNRWIDPQIGGLRQYSSSTPDDTQLPLTVQASAVHAALDQLSQLETSANLSVSLGSADNGENIK